MRAGDTQLTINLIQMGWNQIQITEISWFFVCSSVRRTNAKRDLEKVNHQK
jgi:hypothetical protein